MISVKRMVAGGLIAAAGLLGAAGMAQARDVYWNVGVGGPGISVGVGNAPVYEPWEPQAQVRDAAGQVLGTQALLNVAQVQDIIAGRPAQIDTRWTLPGAAPAGTYTLHLAWVRNPALALSQAMHWNMAGVEPDGSVRVATLRRH